MKIEKHQRASLFHKNFPLSVNVTAIHFVSSQSKTLYFHRTTSVAPFSHVVYLQHTSIAQN